MLMKQSSNSRAGDTLVTQIDQNILKNDFRYDGINDTLQESLNQKNYQ